MNANITCPHCGTAFTIRRELVGKRTKCTRCGTAFTIAESPAALAAPPSDKANAVASSAPPSVPHISIAPQAPPPPDPAITHPARETTNTTSTQPRFTVLHLVARIYEVLAVCILVVAAFLFLMLFIALVRAPSAVLGVLVGSGLTFFWTSVAAVSLFAMAQAIRLALQIEENTRETKAACRQLADHLCGIETES